MMNTAVRILKFFLRNLDVLLTIGVAAVIAPLSYFDRLESKAVSAAILSILFLVACSLLVNRETNNRLQQTTEKIWDQMRKPPIEDVLTPYKRWMDEIETRLASAKEVWILSRTGARFWQDYHDQLQGLLDRKGAIRLLVVDPCDGALRMIADSVELARSRDVPGLRAIPANSSDRVTLLRAQVDDFVGYIANLSSQISKGRLALRMIDYLPAHTLVILNGSSEQGIIYVELGTFHSDGRNRPTFSLIKTKDKRLYTLYYDEYQAMWDSARSMDGNQGAKNSGV
jgi:hypothetical protein